MYSTISSRKRGKKLKEILSRPGGWKAFTDLVEGQNTDLPGRRLSLGQVSIRDLFETFVGEVNEQNIRKLRAQSMLADALESDEDEHAVYGKTGGFIPTGVRSLMEAGTAIKTSAFPNITGQLVFSEIRTGFTHENFVLTALIPVVQSAFADTEIVPGIEQQGDDAQEVGEGQEYPTLAIGEEFFDWVAKQKFGKIVSLTEEAITFDRTNQLIKNARAVGFSLGLRREKRLISVFIGATNNYSRNGVALNTYLLAGAFVNAITGQILANFRQVESNELLLERILEPNTGEPIMLLPSDGVLFTTRARFHAARQILGAEQINRNTNLAATNENVENRSANTLDNYRHEWSSLVFQQITRPVPEGLGLTAAQAQEFFWLGSMEAFAWLENWALRTFEQGASSERAFTHDEVMRFKGSWRGAAQVVEPRLMTRSRNT